jgi:CelD/BcsL family acetyltransferase involved in cellulose biosynthesis
VALSSRVADSLEELAPVHDEWDELAVSSSLPFASPAWATAWWRHLQPTGAVLRVILVFEGERLAGVLPLFALGRSYALVGSELAPVEPLARAGLEEEVARVAASALAELRPSPNVIGLRLHGSSADWGGLLDDGWPKKRGLWRWVKSETPLPRVDLREGGFEAWMDRRSSSFRRDVRRNRRKLEEHGGSFRFSTADSLRRDVQEFMRLHRERLAGQGGSNLTSDRVEEMLTAVGSDLLPLGRFRLLCLEMDGRMIAGQLLLAAGSEASAWNSGFDEAYARYAPSMQCLVRGLRDASERGERTMSLGPGGQSYKRRLATEDDCLRSVQLLPFGRAYPFLRLRLAPQQARHWLGRRLSPETKRRLWRLVGR